jgi:NADPH:quinone reductase-like Zn-dependent oxidoreductase
MRNVAVFGARNRPVARALSVSGSVLIDGVRFRCGVVRTPDVAFDPAAAANRFRVLVRVRAASCNYRDRGLIAALRHADAGRFFTVGSEFVAEVAAVGEGVTTLRPGDRVVANYHYEGLPELPGGVRAGVPTNQATKEWQSFHERQLRRVPASMPDEVAAAFALNAQTAYGMVRRLEVRPGANALVTSAASNTSLAILNALRGRGVDVYAATSSEQAVPRLLALGARDVVVVGRGRAGFADDRALGEVLRAAGGADYVLDPFFDLHIARALELLNPFGKYVTCGLAAQTHHAARAAGVDAPEPLGAIAVQLIMKNLTVLGNCVGLTEDLDRALRDYDAGRLDPVVDSVFAGDDVGAFLDRTFNDPARFGKVVYRYD